MTIGELLALGTAHLTNAGVETPRLDCLIILEDVLGTDRAHILAYPDAIVTPSQQGKSMQLLEQRSQHIPLAYIRGKAMFYGREFIVDEHVLTPRPETEAIIDLLKTLSLPTGATVADIGTGSGCIGITAALELPSTSVILYDIDPDALMIARKNCEQLGAKNVTFAPLNVLEALPKNCDVILANLPYVPESYPINKAATFEPKLALFSGPDGLDHYRALWRHLSDASRKPKYIITESLPSQHHALAQLARHSGYFLEKTDDFIQLFSL